MLELEKVSDFVGLAGAVPTGDRDGVIAFVSV
jgi:hypothetical protein